jgi:hypothetical protein
MPPHCLSVDLYNLKGWQNSLNLDHEKKDKFPRDKEFGLVIGNIWHLKHISTSNHSAIHNSQTLQFTTARTNSSHSAVSSPIVVW